MKAKQRKKKHTKSPARMYHKAHWISNLNIHTFRASFSFVAVIETWPNTFKYDWTSRSIRNQFRYKNALERTQCAALPKIDTFHFDFVPHPFIFLCVISWIYCYVYFAWLTMCRTRLFECEFDGMFVIRLFASARIDWWKSLMHMKTQRNSIISFSV